MTWASASKTLNPLRIQTPPLSRALPPGRPEPRVSAGFRWPVSAKEGDLSEMDVLVDGLRFAEGLRWHKDELWFSDMLDRRVYRCTTTGDLAVVADGIDQPSGLGFVDAGLLVVERGSATVLLVGDDGGRTTHADLGAIGTVRPNDMVTDAAGWSYAGSLGHEYTLGEEKLGLDGTFDGTLLAIAPDGSARVAAGGLGCPNAMVLLDGG